MNYALLEQDRVINLIWLDPANEEDFPGAVLCGDVPVQVGDTYDGQQFFRDGQRVMTQTEMLNRQIAEMDEAMMELQYLQLTGGFDE